MTFHDVVIIGAGPAGLAAAIGAREAGADDILILERDKAPFYCCAWCNIKSARTAIKSGFRPAWVEMTVKKAELVEQMNQKK